MQPPTNRTDNNLAHDENPKSSVFDTREEFSKWVSSCNSKKLSPQASVACIDKISKYVVSKNISCSIWKLSKPSTFNPIYQKVLNTKMLRIMEHKTYKDFVVAGLIYMKFLREKPWTKAVNAETEILTSQKNTIDGLPVDVSALCTLTTMTTQYLLPTDSIEKAALSVRSYNALRRAGINTVEAMLSLDRELMSTFKNLGAKSIGEIEQLQNEIKNGRGHRLVETTNIHERNALQLDKTVVFYDEFGILRNDIHVKDLKLSHRASRILMETGYDYASKLLGITTDQLFALPKMGKGSVDEIQSVISMLEFSEAEKEDNLITQAEKDCMGFVFRFIKYIPAHGGQLFLALLPHFDDAYKNSDAINVETLFENIALRKLIVNEILSRLTTRLFGIEKSELLSSFPHDIVSDNIITTILNELCVANEIRIGQMIEIRRPTLWEYVNSIKDEKQKEILSLRLQGKTLEEIGSIKGGVTRERIRQIIKKCIGNKNAQQIMIEEDKYCGIYESYSFSKDDFLLAFNMDDSAYTYLTLVCDKIGTTPAENFLEDANYLIELRKGAERAIYKNYFTINGIRVLKQRAALVEYIIHTYFQDEATIDELENVYNNTLYELGESNNENFALSKATYRNRLADAENVLWKYPSKLRYYDMAGRDFTDLLEGLHLEQYSNIEYSSLKFFRSYPALMEEYDLRDEYELHNLLKKIFAKQVGGDISFSRMPNIEFGKADRDNQVIDLLIRLAPISVDDFCMEYEAEYGVLARTVAANYIACIDEYKKPNGFYDITPEPLPYEHSRKLQEHLNENYYDIAFIKKLYQEELFGDPDMVNSYTLKNMGFNVFNSYVIRNEFSNASEYFRHILTSEDFVDSKSFLTTLTSQISYTSELYSLKKRYEIVEYEPLCYVNRRKLEAMGITTGDLKDYCDKVFEFVRPKTFFTIYSLRKQGFVHYLEDGVSFGDWFYASILTENKGRYRYQRMGGTKVFCSGAQQVLMEDLFAYVLDEHDSIEINTFIAMLASEYDVILDRGKVVEILNSSSMYYDKSTTTIYANTIKENLLQKGTDEESFTDALFDSHISKTQLLTDAVSLSSEETNEITSLIAKKFKNGFRVSSSIDFDRFKGFYTEEYDKDFKYNADELNRFVISTALIYDERAYFYSDEVVNVVRMHMESLESPCIFIDFFYNEFASEFYNMNIFSVDKLRAFIEKSYPDISIKWDYILMKNSLSPADLIKSTFNEREAWNLEELYKKLPCLKIDTIRQAMNGAEYFRVATNTYTHIDNLDLPDSEGEKIANLVENKLQFHDYVGANELDFSAFEKLNHHCPFNTIRDAVFYKFLSNKYEKSGQIITRKGVKLRTLDVLEQYCRNSETVSFEEINALETKLDPKGRGHSLCLVAGHNTMVRVSEDLFVSESKIDFDIEKIDDGIALYCYGNFIPLRGVTDFSLFQYVGYQWNLFLLESYVRKFSRAFRYDVRAVNSSNIGAIVRKSFQYNEYDDILAHTLAQSLVDLDDKDAIGNYLFDNGYIGIRSLGKKENAILNMAKKIREEE